MQTPIDVTELPRATVHLNYPKAGPAVGSYLGPNDLGEYLTVVSSEPIVWSTIMDAAPPHLPQRRVGLRHGLYTIGGQAIDPKGLPPEVLMASIRKQVAEQAAQYEPFRTPPIRTTGEEA